MDAHKTASASKLVKKATGALLGGLMLASAFAGTAGASAPAKPMPDGLLGAGEFGGMHRDGPLALGGRDAGQILAADLGRHGHGAEGLPVGGTPFDRRPEPVGGAAGVTVGQKDRDVVGPGGGPWLRLD